MSSQPPRTRLPAEIILRRSRRSGAYAKGFDRFQLATTQSDARAGHSQLPTGQSTLRKVDVSLALL